MCFGLVRHGEWLRLGLRGSFSSCGRWLLRSSHLVGDHCLDFGSQLLPRRVVSATITSSPCVRILVLLLGLKRLGNTDGAALNICCLNASVSLAWTAL